MEINDIDIIDKSINAICQFIVVSLSLGIGVILLERIRTINPF